MSLEYDYTMGFIIYNGYLLCIHTFVLSMRGWTILDCLKRFSPFYYSRYLFSGVLLIPSRVVCNVFYSTRVHLKLPIGIRAK